MNISEKVYVRTRFEIEIHRRTGKSFQDLFWQIMVANNVDFTPVKPYGNIGDRSNDGFDPTSGTYYQVYAPEDSTANITRTVNKLHHDFNGLYNYWNNSTPINFFYFVVNDRFMGVGPQLHPELRKIEKDYPPVKCKEFFAQQLREILLGLADDQIYDILGHIPDPANIAPFEPDVMNEVVRHLVSTNTSYVLSRIPINPNFELKLTFNKLGTHSATLLRFASYQYGSLRDFFSTEAILKEKLKQIFTNLYNRGLEIIPESEEDRNDKIFEYILQESHPQASSRKVITDAILVLMSYYFNFCDIFEEPPLQIQTTLFD